MNTEKIASVEGSTESIGSSSASFEEENDVSPPRRAKMAAGKPLSTTG